MRINNPAYSLFLLLIPGIILLYGCNQKKKATALFNGYDLQNPKKIFMPESLLEISGISFRNGNYDTVYAVQDEAGKLFRVPLNAKMQFNCKFWKGGDYEDLAIIRETVFILKSDGRIYSFPLSEAAYPDTDSTREWNKILPEGEYEGLYGDEHERKLYILCKNCPGEENGKRVTGFILSIDDPGAPPQEFHANLEGITEIEEKIGRGFRPSALSRHPQTGEWYILSASNQLLLLADSNWHVTGSTLLPESVFNLPEGIAFDSSGNLYVSNEGDDMNPGKILKFTQLNKPH